MSRLFLLILAASLLSAAPNGKARRYLKKLAAYRVEKEAEFKDPRRSPLRDKAPTFEGNQYYAGNYAFRVEADVKLIEDGEPFLMPTSNPERQKTYIPYAKLHFRLQDKERTLTAYYSPQTARLPGYEDHLFLPFTDLTNGQETYGGGRYLDMRKPKGEKIWIDFNKCYNPYCAYSDGWSCPIPPRENFLEARIEAGVKDYKH
ncbi:MAG: DUF1684 domain-containing protein [Bacteroidota bacterium]